MSKRMKVTVVQRIFAYDVPGTLCYFGFPIAAVAITFWATETPWSYSLGISVLIVVFMVPVGLLSAGLFICFFLSPLYLAVERMNGGPFKPGDRVYVLVGRHKGRVTEVYSNWQGLAVRIRIGEYEEKTRKDIYSSTSLVKVKGAERRGAGARPLRGRPTDP